jgi:hypothetical protein
MRNFTMTTRRKDGTKGRIVLQAESFKDALYLAGNPVVVYSKPEPWNPDVREMKEIKPRGGK